MKLALVSLALVMFALSVPAAAAEAKRSARISR